MSVEVLFSNDDVTVLGPPTNIDVQVDIGPQGVRGSQMFVGVGNPNEVVIGQTPLLNDLYINTSPGADYSYLYQYRAEPGGDTWVEVLKMNPTIFNKQDTVTFTSGTAEVIIPISDIVIITGSSLDASNFNVQYSFLHSNPVACSITSLSVVSESLVIDLKAVESNSGTWQNLAGEVDMQFFISIML